MVECKRQSDRANCIDSLEGNLKLVRQLCTCTDIDFELGENFGFIHIDGAAFSGRPKVLQALIQHFFKHLVFQEIYYYSKKD